MLGLSQAQLPLARDYVSAADLVFDGQTGGSLKTFTTSISNAFVTSKPNVQESQGDDEFLINSVKINCEIIRKLSFSIQLSDPDDYEGGNLQLMDENNKSYIAPRQRGTIILFDSRTPHRVQKVRSGERKSIVGWVVGPRWK